MMSKGGVLPLPTLVGERKFYTAILMGGGLAQVDPNNNGIYLLSVSTLHYTLA